MAGQGKAIAGAIARVIANRWVISLIGLALLAALIWFGGPYLGLGHQQPLAPASHRLFAILGVVIAFLALHLGIALAARRTDARVSAALAQSDAADAAEAARAEEVAPIEQRFREALKDLRSLKLGGRFGRSHLYQLRWYVLIGPPGVGKTTALSKSGLRFPLNERGVDTGGRGIAGVGGTRNCEWFFTDEAVLIDTAGRWVTQAATVDQAAWQGFLDLLRRHRRRRPLDGILIAFSVEDLIQADEQKREAAARTVRHRVQEIYGSLEVRPPIYVIFTKCDTIAGFAEFFADIGREARQQVWGMTFPLAGSQDPDSAVALFPGEYDLLLDRLSGRLVGRLHDEDDAARAGAILLFPQQMALLREPIQQFLHAAFGGNRFEHPALLRGVYFSSALQAGNPVDRLLASVAAEFGVASQRLSHPGGARSYFLTRLLRDVVFKEAALVTSTRFVERHRRTILYGTYGGIALVFLAVTGLLLASYVANARTVARFGDALDALAVRQQTVVPGDTASLVPLLNDIRNLPGGYGERRAGGGGWFDGVGLSQADTLGTAAESVYRRALNRALLPQLAADLRGEIRARMNDADGLFSALRAYLMLLMPERRVPPELEQHLVRAFAARHPGVEAEPLTRAFAAHVAALLEGELADVVNPAGTDPLIEEAQQRLLTVPRANRLYEGIRSRRLGDPDAVWRLAEAVPARDMAFFRNRRAPNEPLTVPLFFSRAGYRDQFLPDRAQAVAQAGKEAWVLGDAFVRLEAERARSEAGDGGLDRRITELYVDDYIRAWDGLLDRLEVVTYRDSERLAGVARVMAAPDSPLKPVLAAVAAETMLVSQPGTPPGEAQRADPAARVDQYFKVLHDLVRPDGQGRLPLERATASLRDVDTQVSRLAMGQGPATGSVGGTGAMAIEGREALRRAAAEARQQPPVLQRMMLQVTDAGQEMLAKQEPREIGRLIADAWTKTVWPECRAAIADRFPFAPAAAPDVTLADFARFFGPGGTIDRFISQSVAPIASTAGHPWRWNTGGVTPVGLSAGALPLLEAAADIRAAFFATGGNRPGFSFDAAIGALDSRASRVVFDVGGRAMEYKFGPVRRERFAWPGETPAASISFFPADDPGRTVVLAASGPWALFRLLAKAADIAGEGERIDVTLAQHGLAAQVTLYADSAVASPWRLPALDAFRCRERL